MTTAFSVQDEASVGDAPSADEICAQMRRILADPRLQASLARRELLRFVVEETLCSLGSLESDHPRAGETAMSSTGTDDEVHEMQSVIPGLLASAPARLSFAPSMRIRAFVLRRRQGNLLVYSATSVADDLQAIEEQGGISRHYLNHWHEAAFGGADRLASTFRAPLVCHESERQSVSETTKVAETFSLRHMEGDDFEVIPIPGHTSGTTAYLWDSGQHRCLFTGDTLYLREGEWLAAVLESSDRAAYIESLELIKELDFDVFVPWLATAGQPFHTVTDKADARRRIDAVLERIRRGGDH